MVRMSGRAVFTAATALAAVLACSSSPEARAAATADDAFRTLPPHAQGLMGVDMASLRSSFLYERFLDRVGTSDLDDWATMSGFDPRQDIDSIAGALWGEPTTESALFVMRGRFDLTPEAKAQIEEVGSHRGVTIYSGPEVHREESYQQTVFAFPEPGVAVLGPHAEVVNAIERRLAGGPSLMDNAALTARAREAAGIGQLWFVSESPGALTQALPEGLAPNQARLLTILAGMRETVAALDLSQGLRLSFSGTAGSVEDASTLADAARGMVALARISLPAEEQDLMKYLDRVRIGGSGDRFEASIELDRFEVEELLDKAEPDKVAE